MIIQCCFPVVFASKKAKSDRKSSQKRKKLENEQVLSGQNSTLFGCANPSPNNATNAFELLGHLTYSLLLPFLLPWLESLLSISIGASVLKSTNSRSALGTGCLTAPSSPPVFDP
jgi:hypothetical protein